MSEAYYIRLAEMQEELAQCYRQWLGQFPDTIHWKNKTALETPWWDRAAGFCLRENISGPLLFFVVFAYGNSCPEDPEIPFSSTTFRSEHLLYRALANFRSNMGISLSKFEVCYNIDTHQPLVLPTKAGELARLGAHLACRYFESMMEVQVYSLMRGKDRIPDILYDSMAYKLCEQNPMLLLRVARTPKVKALAAVNAFFLCDRQPWHTFVWEGIASPFSLRDPSQMAGVDVRQYYEDRRIKPLWPVSITGEPPWRGEADHLNHPTLCLSHVPLCERTQMFLDTKWEMIKRGVQPPDNTTPL